MVLLCLFCCNIYFSVHQYQLGVVLVAVVSFIGDKQDIAFAFS